jgi:hypothetical protein
MAISIFGSGTNGFAGGKFTGLSSSAGAAEAEGCPP